MSRLDGMGPFELRTPLAPRTGRLLVAEPRMSDPTFAGTIVLLLNHSDDGSMGVVLNRRLQARVVDVLPVWGPYVSPPDSLFQGGPVGLDAAIGMAILPGDGVEPVGVRRLINAFAVIDLDAPPEVVRPAVAGVRVFAGHAGWSPGQLEAEVDEGAWFVVDAEPGDLISQDDLVLRRQVLRRQRSSLALWSTMPLAPHRVNEN